MSPGPFRCRRPSRWLAWRVAVSGACLLSFGVALAQAAAPAPAAKPAAAASSAPRVSPYVLAARRHAQEAASAPQPINPLMLHRPRVPRAGGRG